MKSYDGYAIIYNRNDKKHHIFRSKIIAQYVDTDNEYHININDSALVSVGNIKEIINEINIYNNTSLCELINNSDNKLELPIKHIVLLDTNKIKDINFYEIEKSISSSSVDNIRNCNSISNIKTLSNNRNIMGYYEFYMCINNFVNGVKTFEAAAKREDAIMLASYIGKSVCPKCFCKLYEEVHEEIKED